MATWWEILNESDWLRHVCMNTNWENVSLYSLISNFKLVRIVKKPEFVMKYNIQVF